MPYKSDAQRRFMHWKHPEIAKRWDKEYPHQKGLPEHVKKHKKAAMDKNALSSGLKLRALLERSKRGLMGAAAAPGNMAGRALETAGHKIKPPTVDVPLEGGALAHVPDFTSPGKRMRNALGEQMLAAGEKVHEHQLAAGAGMLGAGALAAGGLYGAHKMLDDDKTASIKEVNDMNAEVIEAIQVSAVALDKAASELNEKDAAVKAYTDKVPSVIDKLASVKYIDDTAEDREKMATWLATPEGALQVIEKLAEIGVAVPEPKQETTKLGHEVDSNLRPASAPREKRASKEGGGYVGKRDNPEESDAWRNMGLAFGFNG